MLAQAPSASAKAVVVSMEMSDRVIMVRLPCLTGFMRRTLNVN